VGGIQLYGGPYGCVRAGFGFGFGSATLSFSLRGQILSLMRGFGEAVGVDITRRCWGRCSELTGKCDDMGLGEFVRRREGIDSGDDMIFDVKEGEGSDIGAGRRIWRLARSAATTKVKLKTNKPNRDDIPPRSRTSIGLDFFKNPNLPLWVTLARPSPFSPTITCSPNSETAVDDDDDDVVVVVDPIVEERLQGSTRVRRAENARLISVGASVSVSAEESGELSRVTGADRGRAPDCTVRLLQRGNGMIRRPRGDDGADSGAEGTVVRVACSSNET
jgi:hypothetical protein